MSLLFKPCSHNLELCKRLADILKQVAQLYRKQAASTSDALDQLYREALFKSFTMVNRFHALLESKDLEVQPVTFHRLLVRVMSTASIPFHGEPAIGMQVMGYWKHVTWISAMSFCCRSTKASCPRQAVMLRSSPITCARRSA